MKIKKKYPAITLAPFVRYYWYFEIEAAEIPVAQLSFPYGAFELICYLENPNHMRWTNSSYEFTEPEFFYAGQLTKPLVMTFNEPCKCAGVSLYPWAGSHLFNIPAGEFTNELVPIADLEKGNDFYGQLKLAAGEATIFTCLENYLLQKLAPKQNDPVVYALARQIIDQPTRDALNTRLSAIGLSRRRIEQRFMDTTGLSMGAFTRKVRFQKAVHLLKENNARLSFTSVGLKAGYYDQAHFISDFKEFSGMSPKYFQQQKTDLNDFLKTMVLVG
eukprot:gnl/Spiro4/25607_TR12751_c0_g1_i1.p1 gnl/Spiro4/25607_TR12751_c0_g1~~gnl/Spiro4/25607_TR12751_c0_g1_i1.p1  ORF type:complete len:274 (+),score=-23.00 gnl/Spiro4/25607_TR12751_c0_g1_i1:818-1639(+)